MLLVIDINKVLPDLIVKLKTDLVYIIIFY